MLSGVSGWYDTIAIASSISLTTLEVLRSKNLTPFLYGNARVKLEPSLLFYLSTLSHWLEKFFYIHYFLRFSGEVLTDFVDVIFGKTDTFWAFMKLLNSNGFYWIFLKVSLKNSLMLLLRMVALLMGTLSCVNA